MNMAKRSSRPSRQPQEGDSGGPFKSLTRRLQRVGTSLAAAFSRKRRKSGSQMAEMDPGVTCVGSSSGDPQMGQVSYPHATAWTPLQPPPPPRKPPAAHLAPARQPSGLEKPLSPLRARAYALDNLTRHDDPMQPATVSRVVAWLGQSLPHLPYAVTGLAALTIHGFRGRAPSHVSVICPAHCREVVMAWAAVKGVVLYHPSRSEFGVQLAGERRHVRRVRVWFADGGFFAGLGTVDMSGGRVLGLPSLVDVLAGEFMNMTGASAAAAEGRVGLGRAIVWGVERMVGAGARVGDARVRNVGNPLFLEPFACTFPGARELLARAGFIGLQPIPEEVEVSPRTPGHEGPLASTSTSSEYRNRVRYGYVEDGNSGGTTVVVLDV